MTMTVIITKAPDSGCSVLSDIRRIIYSIVICTVVITCNTAEAFSQNIYYETTIKAIIANDCSRCHSGPVRNLMDYDNLKAYSNSGMLTAMVNGSMRLFAGNDSAAILSWIDNGAPEKPANRVANWFKSGNGNVQAPNVYYEPTVNKIIAHDCGRCHSGPVRNLMDYDNLKTYADSGMLKAMVQGPMGRFAGNDSVTILDWINGGSQEKKELIPVVLTVKNNAAAGGRVCPPGAHSNVQAARITYTNTIKYVLEGDCMQCHSGKFRNLSTFKNVKMYADNGLLKTLIRLGGPMHRFAGPDSGIIIKWINQGAPR